jgi:hypothetical protein
MEKSKIVNSLYINGMLTLPGIDEELKEQLGENARE